MITAIDTSVLLDIITDDAVFAKPSLVALRDAAMLGSLVVCPVVWAELRGSFDDDAAMSGAFASAGIGFDPFDRACADVAGASWRAYRRNGGTRTRVVADFFIGAHARTRADRLLTRDRGFFRRYFSELEIIDPTSS